MENEYRIGSYVIKNNGYENLIIKYKRTLFEITGVFENVTAFIKKAIEEELHVVVCDTGEKKIFIKEFKTYEESIEFIYECCDNYSRFRVVKLSLFDDDAHF